MNLKGKTLFITARSSLYSVKTNVAGAKRPRLASTKKATSTAARP